MTDPLPSPRSDTPIPEAVLAAFDIVRPLGQGGMGSVWLARDRLLDRLVAIKVLLTGSATDATRERFLREARTAAKLGHPNIVPVHRADESNGQVWFSMAFIEGESLGDRIRERGALPPADVVRILREASWALAYAHARGVIHRDVKPDNIMLERESGRTMVTDFGIARDVRFIDAPLTVDGSVLGTVHYMSPEQAADDPLDARSDVYSLGVVGFHALSNSLPFEGTPNAILVSHVTKPAPTLRSVAPSVPAPIAAVIDKCLAKEPGARWESAEALADALDAALDDVETAARTADAGTAGEALSERDAMAVWQRAAQLQAEAARRMERSVVRGAGPIPGPDAAPTDALRRVDVEAAAVEAGISRQFVAIALAEHSAGAGAGNGSLILLDSKAEQRITTMLGTRDRSISASRVIRADAKTTLAAIGRVFTAQPYLMKVRETVNGHPLDGGILRFEVPNLMRAMSEGYVGSGVGTGHGLIYRCYQLEMYLLNVTLKPRGTPAAPECEVVISGDLREGQRKNLSVAYKSIGGMSVGSLALATPIAIKALGLAAAVAALPVVAAAGAVGALTMIGYRASFRNALVKAREELDNALAALQQQIDSAQLFGELPAVAPVAKRRDISADDAFVTIIS
ncbi:MAG TPA: serine/threonine-protein kinase [Gemmatimonadaceae bacterium]|nr:serine/threonine-protein kinase [Gemmatimonadaceae bacterium]